MKKALFILCFFIPFSAVGANKLDTIINVTKPGGYNQLNKGWKFYAGDNPDFAHVDYNDSNWQWINPALTRGKLPAAAQTGIGWLRLRFHIADSLQNKINLTVYENAAIEIYLNGKIIARHGSINTQTKSGRGYHNFYPVSLPFSTGSIQVLAIRYAHQANMHYFNSSIQGPFCTLFFTNDAETSKWHSIFINFMVWVAICMSALLLLAIIHLVFFYFNRGKKENLYFACYAVSYAIFLATFLYLLGIIDHPIYVDVAFLLNVVRFIMLLTGGIFGVRALYSLYGLKPGRLYNWLTILAPTGLIILVFDNKFNGAIYFVILIFVIAYQIWLAAKAVINKIRGAEIVAIGFLGNIVGIAIGIYVQFRFGPGHRIFWEAFPIAVTLSMLSPAFGISLFLSREFALDSQLLAVKLDQVQQLSAINLANEQEKQLMLASQNIKLEQQVEERTTKLNQSVNELKNTQTQLLQKTKMALLGELTTSIAHEILNPLNFVNNFSELSVELIEELKEGAEAGNKADVMAIANDLSQNLERIHHHGRRADLIIKSMLEQNRAGAGQKEFANLNALADEFFKLSYHGMRAKDKNFNVELINHFDDKLPKIEIVQQDIGRVLLNLFNNAFYAVNLKQKTTGAVYKPTVELATFVPPSGGWGVKVRDNGDGIPSAIKDKIMQPFFTTKPAGEGTGLGLSLSYDIVVKGHGGTITFDTKAGVFTEFTITVPLMAG